MIRILIVAGARPNFMKIMPLIKEFKKHLKRISYTFVHTGQHYDFSMSKNFFKDLNIPKPDILLNVGSGTHGVQTARVIEGIEKILLKKRYDLLTVVGDVNSTIAAALAASKLGVKIAHIESGLRSFDRTMPEEINRVLTDHISDYLFTTEDYGNKNLIKEGIDPKKIFFVGDIMVDSRRLLKKKIKQSSVLDNLKLRSKEYYLVTLHRPSNVDTKSDLINIIEILNTISNNVKVVFPVHPRTRKMIEGHKIKTDRLYITKPLGYLDFQKLLENSKLVLTDSGGIQEEATILKIPCITIRENTERPITVKQGTNYLTGANKSKILAVIDSISKGRCKRSLIPPKWDGKTAQRVVKVLLKKEKQICKKN